MSQAVLISKKEKYQNIYKNYLLLFYQNTIIPFFFEINTKEEKIKMQQNMLNISIIKLIELLNQDYSIISNHTLNRKPKVLSHLKSNINLSQFYKPIKIEVFLSLFPSQLKEDFTSFLKKQNINIKNFDSVHKFCKQYKNIGD